MDGTAYRLIGVGLSGLNAADGSDPIDLIEPGIARKAAAERAIDKVRDRFGRKALVRGRLYDHNSPETTPDNDQDKS